MTDTVHDPARRPSRFSQVLLAVCLLGLPLAIWSGWAVWDKGPKFDQANRFWLLVFVAWLAAVSVSLLIDKQRRSALTLRAVTDDSGKPAEIGPRMKAAGGLLASAWVLLSGLSIGAAILETGEPLRIAAATPLAAVVMILLAQTVWRSLRGLAPQHLGAGRL